MNILILSDLHLHFWNNSIAMSHYKNVVYNTFHNINFDCIVISGDIFESDIMSSSYNPYKMLRNIFDFTNKPIICCLGNHEFAYKTTDKVLSYYDSFKERYNIHYLDVENSYQLNNYNFVGNVFWYDNSLGNNPFSKPDFILPSWLDSTIRDFIPSKECKKCQDKILQSINHNMKNILITHTVPHYKLNWFSINQPDSFYNQYSGCKDFLKDLKDVVLSISGHTHKRIMDTIYNIDCVNVGNDYLDENDTIKYYLMKLDE